MSANKLKPKATYTNVDHFGEALAVLSQKLKSVETQDEAWSDEEEKPTQKEETAVTMEEPTNNAQNTVPDE